VSWLRLPRTEYGSTELLERDARERDSSLGSAGRAIEPSRGTVPSPRALSGVGQGLIACACLEEFGRESVDSRRRAEFWRELEKESGSCGACVCGC